MVAFGAQVHIFFHTIGWTKRHFAAFADSSGWPAPVGYGTETRTDVSNFRKLVYDAEPINVCPLLATYCSVIRYGTQTCSCLSCWKSTVTDAAISLLFGFLSLRLVRMTLPSAASIHMVPDESAS